jgi:type III restriction enzyme
MKLQFDAHQEYQLDAIRTVTGVFEGQGKVAAGFALADAGMFGETGAANMLMLSEEQIEENVRKVQGENKIAAPDTFAGMNFTVEMETGTGKTYVYLRTILELYEQYQFTKFIIVVPSIAIREGVLKNLEITKEHFRGLYANVPFDYFVYDAKKLGKIRQFATANTLQIMIINIDAFTRDENVIRQESDKFQGVPLELICKTNPIVIVDEPQNMESAKRKAAISSLNPLCTLRYSATHKEHYNLLYRLTPVDAYNFGLVKKIEVASIEEAGSNNDMFLEVVSITPGTRSVGATIKFEYSHDGEVKQKSKAIKADTGIDLFRESGGLEQYRGVDVRGITQEGVVFAIGTRELMLGVGDKTGVIDDAIAREQIRATIEEHLKKKELLNREGIKVLSLFFIDRVEHYRGTADGKRGKFLAWFEEIWGEFRAGKYKGLNLPEAAAVHKGYFSQDRKGNLQNTTGETQADEGAYDLIMKDKERLLSFEEPVECIWSHSALKEGWDNPNVFQICVLRDMGSMLTKRQTIGRGLRLPVRQDGTRVVDSTMNVVTVVANESYELFAASLQQEMEQAGIKFEKSLIKKKEKRVAAHLKERYMEDVNFKELWEKIKHQTQYHVEIDTTKLVERAGVRLASEISVKPPRIRKRVTAVAINSEGVHGETTQDRTRAEIIPFPIPDLLGVIVRMTNLSRSAVFDMLRASGKLHDAVINPQEFIDQCVEIIRAAMKDEMIDGIKYEKIEGDGYHMKRFENDELMGYLESNMTVVQKPEKTLFDHIVYDSDVEKDFFIELEARNEVKFYLKLPRWFTIETPVGTYNPDWAVTFEDDHRVYFVAETKGARFDELPKPQQQKIICGERHFAELDGVVYRGRSVRTVNDLLD